MPRYKNGTPSYTADTLPDPATLAPGATVVIDGELLLKSGDGFAGVSPLSVDVVVYGATPGGIAAAVNASRQGARVVLLEPKQLIGGMMTGGLSYTDVNKQLHRGSVVGYADEFFKKLAKKYGTTQQHFFRKSYNAEPRIFDRFLKAELTSAGIETHVGAELISVSKIGTQIKSATFSTVGTVVGKVFIDATYEGDLLAKAGLSFYLGRESNATYGETLNGLTGPVAIAQFADGIDPYVVPGNAASGLLKGIWPAEMGTTGDASPYVQSFNYRLCVTADNLIKIAIPEPDNYDAADYELLGRHAVASGSGWTTYNDVLLLYGLQDVRKYDANNKGVFSLNFVMPECTEYVTATEERRREIEYTVTQYIYGLFKFLKTDSRIPLACRNSVATLGFCSNEFQPNNGMSTALYVREGRRLIGDFVLKEAHVTTANGFTDPVAYTYYAIDSHHVRRVYVPGVGVKNEGALHADPIGGNPIPWRVCLPKVAECTNMLATFAVSASHVAFCSIRMEPIHMALGQHCGIAAAIAAAQGIKVQDVSYTELSRITNINGATSLTENTLPPGYVSQSNGARIIDLSGTFTDGTRTETGAWTDGIGFWGYVGTKYKASSATGASQKFQPNIPMAGLYDIYIKWPDPEAATRSAVVPVTITTLSGTVSLVIDQNADGVGGDWFHAGQYIFAAGAPSANFVTVGTDGAGGSTIISAVKFIPV